LPLLSEFPYQATLARTIIDDSKASPFNLPTRIQNELFKLYGDQASAVAHTERMSLKVPPIAENAAVVSLSVTGEKGYVSSLAIFVENNPKTLTSVCTLHKGADLAVSLRVKVSKTSDIYAIAKTQNGLVGVKRIVKVTMGCMGG
jgi:predicted secreted protein